MGDQLNLLFLGLFLEQVYGFHDQIMDVQGAVVDVCALGRELGVLQHIIDDAQQVVAGILYGAHALALVGCQWRVAKDFRHAKDAAQRGTNVMADPGQGFPASAVHGLGNGF